MNPSIDIKYCIFFYMIVLVFIYVWKPEIFKMEGDNKKSKKILLFALIVILAILSIYMKVFFEWFF